MGTLTTIHSRCRPATKNANLAPYWLEDHPRGQKFSRPACAFQTEVCSRALAPKQITTPEFTGLANYAYHLDRRQIRAFFYASTVSTSWVSGTCTTRSSGSSQRIPATFRRVVTKGGEGARRGHLHRLQRVFLAFDRQALWRPVPIPRRTRSSSTRRGRSRFRTRPMTPRSPRRP